MSQPTRNVRSALKELYPKHDFKTVTGNGTYVHGNTREIQEHPAYAGWGEPGWDLDVEYRDTDSGAFEVEIDNYAKLLSRKTVIRVEAIGGDSTRISVRSNQHSGLLNLDYPNPAFARSRLYEIRTFLSQGGQ
ncbi:hypothetical protein ACFQY0_20815 [Haloferula chungangensis]|uniref:Uncharacterized protein n=1 Tax=Haloferula chungangensis TaxID=1048331 RepID=A0ABW2LCU7_9BACT